MTINKSYKKQSEINLRWVETLYISGPDEGVDDPTRVLREVEAGRQMIDRLQRRLPYRPGYVDRVEEPYHRRQHQVDVVVQGRAEVLHGGQHLVGHLPVPWHVVSEHSEDVASKS